MLGRAFILGALFFSVPAWATDPFEWVGPILQNEQPLTIANQRRLSRVLMEREAPAELRGRIIGAFAHSPVRDAETFRQLLRAFDFPANEPWRRVLRVRLAETGRADILGFRPEERVALEKALIELANDGRASEFARRRAFNALTRMGLSDRSRDLGRLVGFSTGDLGPLFHARCERSSFAAHWLLDTPDLPKLRSEILATKARMTLPEFHAGMISMLGHPLPEVRELAAQILEEALRADTAFPVHVLPSEVARLQRYFRLHGVAPFLAWRLAEDDDQRAAILNRVEASHDPEIKGEIARAMRWDKIPNSESTPLHRRATALIDGCQAGHAQLLSR